jgi:hypothetical protein
VRKLQERLGKLLGLGAKDGTAPGTVGERCFAPFALVTSVCYGTLAYKIAHTARLFRGKSDLRLGLRIYPFLCSCVSEKVGCKILLPCSLEFGTEYPNKPNI